MTNVSMKNITKSYGDTIALSDFSLEVKSGELICLLGPSGCGKTTALRILAGFIDADSGTITVNGDDISPVPVEKRNFGMVFQDYSLFPNMTTKENIAFGLRAHKIDSVQRTKTIDRMLSITALEDQADKFPHQMSGGQKQRVALARAIATSPHVLLLDEPLSALDAKVRESLREEIRRLQREIGVTTVFVTHDQHEALAISDRVGVMSKGRLEQLATPRDLYLAPANPFVAQFIGSINQISGTGTETGDWRVLGSAVRGSRRARPGETALVGVRPEDLTLERTEHGYYRIYDISFLGPITRVTVVDDTESKLLLDLLSAEINHLRTDDQVSIHLRPDVSWVTVMSA